MRCVFIGNSMCIATKSSTGESQAKLAAYFCPHFAVHANIGPRSSRPLFEELWNCESIDPEPICSPSFERLAYRGFQRLAAEIHRFLRSLDPVRCGAAKAAKSSGGIEHGA
jgi:hypothetical protein